MGHFHKGYHGHGGRLTSLNSTYYLAIALNLCFVAAEAATGIWYDSIGLLSDAGHKLIDVFSLIIALVAFKLTKSKANKRFTYGYRKTSVLLSLFNAIILIAAVCVIVWESIEKIGQPADVSGAAISWTAGAGIIVSGISALLLMHHQGRDINTRVAFLHMATDALVSVGVVISGILISLTGLTVIDPVISLVIAAIILFNTGGLLVESLRMAIDAVPEGVGYDGIEGIIREYPGVSDVVELRIWPVSITETAVTARIEISASSVPEEVADGIREALVERGIDMVTIECKRKKQ